MGRVGNLEDRVAALEQFLEDFSDKLTAAAERTQAQFEQFIESKLSELTKEQKKGGPKHGDKD